MIATATASQSHSALFAADPPSSPSSSSSQTGRPRLTDSGHYLEYDCNLDADADADADATVQQDGLLHQQANPSPSQQLFSDSAAAAAAAATAAASAGSVAAQHSHQHQLHHLQNHQNHHQLHQNLQPLQPQAQPEPQPQAQAQAQAQPQPEPQPQPQPQSQPFDYQRHQHTYQPQLQQQQNNLITTTGTAETPTTAAGPATTSVERDRSRMFVRALYEYSTDDSTSLSFRAGDVIQVLKQLDSGWWDGIVNGQRGWFPSNYCVLVGPGDQNGALLSDDSDGDDEGDDVDDDHDHGHDHDHDHDDHDHDADADDDDRDSYGSYDDGSQSSSDSDRGLASPGLPMEGTNLGKNEVAGLWVPQATPHGRLFYFNLETAETRRELPLEAPTSTTESGPRERSRSIPDQTRPPPELLTSSSAAAGVSESEATVMVVLGDEDESRPLPHHTYDSVSDEAAGGWVVLDSVDGAAAAHGNGNAVNGKGVDGVFGYGVASDGGTAVSTTALKLSHCFSLIPSPLVLYLSVVLSLSYYSIAPLPFILFFIVFF